MTMQVVGKWRPVAADNDNKVEALNMIDNYTKNRIPKIAIIKFKTFIETAPDSDKTIGYITTNVLTQINTLKLPILTDIQQQTLNST